MNESPGRDSSKRRTHVPQVRLPRLVGFPENDAPNQVAVNYDLVIRRYHNTDVTLSQKTVPLRERPVVDLEWVPIEETSTCPSEKRQILFIIFISLAQLVQMIPLGAGINSGLAIGQQLNATASQSVWVVASYPLTQGSFVLVGKSLQLIYLCGNLELTSRCLGGRLGAIYGQQGHLHCRLRVAVMLILMQNTNSVFNMQRF